MMIITVIMTIVISTVLVICFIISFNMVTSIDTIRLLYYYVY